MIPPKHLPILRYLWLLLAWLYGAMCMSVVWNYKEDGIGILLRPDFIIETYGHLLRYGKDYFSLLKQDFLISLGLPLVAAVLMWGLQTDIFAWVARRKGKKEKTKAEEEPEESRPRLGPMDREQAYEILGLKPGASREAVKLAYRRLVNKVHPDHDGSKYLTSLINEARDVLLKNKAKDNEANARK
jgi:hypothetical protein